MYRYVYNTLFTGRIPELPYVTMAAIIGIVTPLQRTDSEISLAIVSSFTLYLTASIWPVVADGKLDGKKKKDHCKIQQELSRRRKIPLTPDSRQDHAGKRDI